jgi:hypothetical protein
MAMVILGGMMMMMSGFNEVFNEAIDKQENWEYQFAMQPTRVDEVVTWSEGNTSSFELTLTSHATLTGTTKAISLRGMDVLSDENDAMHRLNLLEGEIPVAGQYPIEVIIDEGSASLEGIIIGDTVSIDHQGQKFDVKISGIARELTRTIQLHRTDLVPIVGDEANGALLILSSEGDVDEIRGSTVSIIEKSTMVDGYHEIMKQQEAMMQSTYLIGGLLAIAILFNTLLINLSERDSELATLRVLGASRSRLSLILTVEHAFIGLIGGIAGALASVAMYKGLSSVMSSWAFHLPVVIDYLVVFKVIGFVLFAALLTTPIGIWRIGRMDLLDVVARHEG